LQYKYCVLEYVRGEPVKLGEKIRYLREVEGSLRGLGRPMTQLELVRAIREETGKSKARGRAKGPSPSPSISQSYLSQIESGSRPHLTNSTRMLLAKFFGVHPGYLVDDPEGFHTELISGVRVEEDQLDLWLISGAERFARDREVSRALLALARHADSRKCLMLLYSILDTPELMDRLLAVLRPAAKLKEAV
jgi:transcriptional regulator with XRE-family HTH domain